MTGNPIVLDERRGMRAQAATELRRLIGAVEADQAALKSSQAELEGQLIAAQAESWPEAMEKARYLIGLFAQTAQARDPRRRVLIANVLADFARLHGKEPQ